MTALLWLSMAGLALAMVLILGRLALLFCRGCALVERKHWMEE